MQRDHADGNGTIPQGIEQFFGEMKACCWRCNGSLFLSIHSLVTFLVCFISFPFNVRGKRHLSLFPDDPLQFLYIFKGYGPVLCHMNPEVVCNGQVSGILFSGKHMPGSAGCLFDQEKLDFSSGRFVPGQTCGEHARIVHYQHITGLQIRRQVREVSVLHTSIPGEHEKTGTVPLFNRFFCYEAVREKKIEISGFHTSAIECPGRNRKGYLCTQRRSWPFPGNSTGRVQRHGQSLFHRKP